MKTVTKILISASIFMFLLPSIAYGIQPSQIYYVPLPEDQIKNSMDILEDVNNNNLFNPVNTIHTVISISPGADGTIVFYDHWEDGYEADLGSPIQPTTSIWGDNDPSNGIPPGFATDIINAGDTIALRNNVPLPTDQSTILFDGRDKFGAHRPLAVTRVAWDDAAGTIIAGAVEVLETRNYGNSFIAPVGEDIFSDSMFEYTSLVVMALEDTTLISIDSNGDGLVEYNPLLNEGESFQVNGGVLAGATVTADKPVQAHLLTGDTYPQGALELRWYTLFPTEDWSDSYFTPVGNSNVTGDRTDIWLYNPNLSAITVNYLTQSTAGIDPPDSFNVPPGEVIRFEMPVGEGAHFFSGDGSPFFAICTVNSPENKSENPDSPDNDTWDWGFSLIPERFLTPQALVGWGPGSSDEPPADNGSPVWVTAPSDTTLFVNYDGSLKIPSDAVFDILALQSVKVFDPDFDQTGMRLFTTDGTVIAVAWGEDPDSAMIANPYLDLGTTVLPFPVFSILKEVELSNDLNGDGWVNPGEPLLYTITITNEGPHFVDQVTVIDEVPDNTTYISGSTTVNGVWQPDNTVPPAVTEFPLDEGGLLIGDLGVGEVFVVTFEVAINDPFPIDVKRVINHVLVTTNIGEKEDEVETPVIDPHIDIQKTVYMGHDGGASCPGAELVHGMAGEAITYCFQITNTGNTYLADVSLLDNDLGLDLIAAGLLAPMGEVSLFHETVLSVDMINTAATSGDPSNEQGQDLAGVEDVTDEDTAEVIVAAPAIDLIKEADRDIAGVGETITYNYIITNVGDVTLTDVSLIDDRLGQITIGKTTLIPQESTTGTATYVVQSADLPGPIINIATASGQPPFGDRVSDQDDELVELIICQPGTGTPGYWKNHPEAWPVDEITIGGVNYTRDEAIAVMNTPAAGDKTYTMFNSLISAKLNALIGNDISCVADTIAAADEWMAQYGPAGSGVGGGSSPWREGESLHTELDSYNNGLLCAPHRDSNIDCEPPPEGKPGEDPDDDPPDPVIEAPGTATPRFWKNQPDTWPVDEINIGGETYTKEECVALMNLNSKRNKTLKMFKALIAAKLNVIIGNNSDCIEEKIIEADEWMAQYGPVEIGTRPRRRNLRWRGGRSIYLVLTAYNKGMLCAPPMN